MLDQTQATLPEDELTEILTQRMEKSVVLKEDIAHVYRMDDGHRNKNYDFLVRSKENYMDRERYRTNRANGLHSMLSQVSREARTGAPSIIDQRGGNGPSEVSEKKKKKTQDRKARATAKAAAAPAPTPTGKGKGKGEEKKVCYYFNQPGGCPKSVEECWFKHKKLSAAEVAKMVQPPSRAGPRAASPAGGRPGPGRKLRPPIKRILAVGKTLVTVSDSRNQKAAQTPTVNTYVHLDEAMIEEFKRAGKVLQDNATAKP